MSTDNITKKVEEMIELEQFANEIKNEIESIKREIQDEMDKRNTEELDLGKYIVRWTSVLSSRFDTKRFKENFGEEVYKAYTKEVSSRRFSIA